MPITEGNPFKGRQFPGEIILMAVRWYLRYPLSFEQVSELLAERGVKVDPSCVWRWVQAYAPELNRRCLPHLKSTNKSYRVDETYIDVKGKEKYLYRGVSRMQVKPAELYRRWEKASRSRLSGVGFKPLGAAAFKRRGGERPRKRRLRRTSGER